MVGTGKLKEEEPEQLRNGADKLKTIKKWKLLLELVYVF